MNNEMLSLLKEWLEIHDEECWYDHHGYCQAHFMQEDCIVKRTREIVSILDKDYLEPCPLCGSNEISIDEDGEYNLSLIDCKTCGCNIYGENETVEDLKLKWNKR